ncbi:dihydrofolate reductase, partial [bacterium]|nr:dihydrofolate reductase [bacterium]
MKKKYLIGMLLTAMIVLSCADKKKTSDSSKEQIGIEKSANFDHNVEQFADIKVLRYQIPGWENLTLKEQKLVYYLTQAGLSGRDIIWDQNYRHNLTIRKAL